ncbi:hypothetical protein ACFV2U_28620 [Streptomyces sp. NPDC059697]|uniref:hypothetical protein n=1 Tax=Streptomyces sp. NPDC059697 TaxID=3346912 RepID=UPI0036A3E32D
MGAGHSISRLHRALTGELDNAPDILCTVHGGFDDVGQEVDDRAPDDDPQEAPTAQGLEAIRETNGSLR